MTAASGRRRHRVPALNLAAELGRGVGRVALGTVGGKLPRRVSDLTAAQLSRILGRRVDRVRVVDGDAGTSSRARLALDCDGVPATVFVKMPAQTFALRFVTELGRLAETETR
ncbi:hypothetical protein KV112_09450 [Mycolicibacter sp. MYC123]|uniref:Aminoglycoside phosphotransferase domain-containing protein n=1 Tax=[Mycobacterium] zoologicum TaxID=2872311 RepID=A0ABU5YIS8_9MYCO|nr:hypothetical protein [Mycolicibacter sp. MYC123]MEB3049953.1 hypothetical protein [Mycolicibacter sp. MYC123]